MRRLLSITLAASLLSASALAQESRTFSRIGVGQGLENSTVFSICQDYEGDMWFATTSGLARYDGYEVCFFRKDNGFLPDNNVYRVREDADSTLLVYTDKGVLGFDRKRSEFIPVNLAPEEPLRLPFTSSAAHAVLEDSGGWCWFGTEGDGLWRANLSTGEAERVDIQGMSHVRALCHDHSNNLWIGTMTGLCVKNLTTGRLSVYTSNPYDPSALSDSSIRCICQDSSGGIWLGTFYGGVNYYHPHKSRFEVIRQQPHPGSLNDNVVGCIVEDGTHNLWIGTNKGGLNVYNPQTGAFKSYSHERVNANVAKESDNIKAVWCDPAGRKVFVGAHAGGLSILDRQTSEKKVFPYPENVYAIIPASEDKLWVGSLEGLYLFDIEKNSYVSYSKDAEVSRVMALARDSHGCLWVGGKGRVSVFEVGRSLELSEIDISPLRDLDKVNGFLCSSAGVMWIATQNGAFFYDRITGQLSHLDVSASGVAASAVFGFEEDAVGRIWLSTDNGLRCYDPSSLIMKAYSAEDGLHGNSFTQFSHCRTSDGTMYFGGIGGITRFVPEKFRDNQFSPSPRITSISVDGSSRVDLREKKEIVLERGRNAFTVFFSVPDYISSGKNSFEYMLKGYDNAPHLTANREVSYSKLRKGRYQFVLRSSNGDGYWCETPDMLSIVVRPFWFQTAAVRITLFLIILSVVFYLIVLYSRQKSLKNRYELERLKARHQEEMDKMRALAFINSGVGKSARTSVFRDNITMQDETFLLKAMKVVDDNLSNPDFTVEEMASAMGMSRSNLHLRIKEVSGESALGMIHKMRFTKACQLLREGELNIAQISDKCGFRSQSYFTSGFKKYMGCTPKEYADTE